MKRFLIVFVLTFSFFFFGCSKDNDEKIKIDMADVIWDYNNDFEYDGKEKSVKLINLPKEVSVTYSGVVSEDSIGLHTATATLSYDSEKYELINNTVPLTLNWKIWDIFAINAAHGTISSSSLYEGRYTRNLINYIHFVNYITEDTSLVTENAPYLWSETIDDELHLYIGYDNTRYRNIKLPPNSAYLFAAMVNLKGITGWENVDTSRVTNMRYMFYKAGYSTTEPWSLDVSSFKTQKVTDMESMFEGLGYSSADFTLSLGDNFDTSNVTNMKSMFEYCGFGSLTFTLSLGNKFNTSKVTSMESMFEKVGYYSTALYIDIGDNFYISNVTNMNRMFIYIYACTNANNWNLHFKGEIRSNVTTEYMFFGFAPKINKTIYVDDNLTRTKLSAAAEGLDFISIQMAN